MKQCSKCLVEKSLTEFSKKKDTKDGLKSCCKLCDKLYYAKFYDKTKDKRKEQAKAQAKKSRAENKPKRLEYLKQHPCVDCGNNDVRVLDFHHLHSKTQSVSRMVNKITSWSKIEQEISKCEVLCANCHRIRHSCLVLSLHLS